MRSTQQFSVTVPTEMAELIRRKVATGEYASESEVFRDGLRALLARDRALEAWLRNVGVPAYQEWKAGKVEGIPIEKAMADLEAREPLQRTFRVDALPEELATAMEAADYDNPDPVPLGPSTPPERSE